MSNFVKRVYAEKKAGFDVEARGLCSDLKDNLGIAGLTSLRIVHRYDMAGLTFEEYEQAKYIIFSEPTVDYVYDETVPMDSEDRIFAIEFLPGQYDQRADSAAQCVQILTQKERPAIRTAKVIMLKGQISDEDFIKIKSYCINPVEAREASLVKPADLELECKEPADVEIIKDFMQKDKKALRDLADAMGLAMSFEDLVFCQTYFRDVEKRDPSITEIRVIDTYWSDHCRHTTFQTKVEKVEFATGHFAEPIVKAYENYVQARDYVYGDKPKDMCLMDIAVMGMKELKKRGGLKDLDVSEEINACSIVVPVEIDGETEEWLVMFKNETHNHPTEIEPFGGAATCLGGAIRDPLSGRAYVYQAMRVTGSADPRTKVEDTLSGKLPQRKITIGAAAGYSSYGNQIGLATGQVSEVYDPDFVAKRMEIGAVIGAVPRKNVVREVPEAGDVIILLGGRTGRDGCGGATGSSKEHTEESLATCGAEVQKGNAPTERKIQRLFRNPEVSTMIKRCNDFGAGGVSVAIGELTDGLDINLDAVPKKYEGLDGTELAISESQERMAVVVAPGNVAEFSRLAAEENLEVTVAAKVNNSNRLRMLWRGKPIVDISRDFLNTNGVQQVTKVKITAPDETETYFDITPSANVADMKKAWLDNLSDLNVCSQKGLAERFDSTIGAGTVLMPFGGKYQSTPTAGMVAKIPLLAGETSTATAMTYGYDPQLAKWSPFHGALYAVVEAVAKIVTLGGEYQSIRLTLQEYFEKLGKDETKWGKPFSALLGALYAQQQLGIAAIGGKDSMSGTFMDLTVPPTLVAFAVDIVKTDRVISQEFKMPGSLVVLVSLPKDGYQVPDFEVLKRNYAKISELIQKKKVLSAHTVAKGGVAAAVSKMAFGNRIGMRLAADIVPEKLFAADYGSIILEMPADTDLLADFGQVDYTVLGCTQSEPAITVNGTAVSLTEALAAWEKPLEKIFATRVDEEFGALKSIETYTGQASSTQRNKKHQGIARPRAFIPVFPGTNCEYDSARAFEKAGAVSDVFVIKNLTSHDVEASIAAIAERISKAQIVMLPGGFSAGDEPDGSGKFIAAMFRNPRIKEAVTNLLENRDGLMLGICNGFQALIKLGLVPYGKIVDLTPDAPTLTYNKIGRHVSRMVNTKVVSTLSPWFSGVQAGEMHTIAVSHGEGRFVASEAVFDKLAAAGQIATQYVDENGQPTYDIAYNPNGSYQAVEGITSPDGRVLGKMGHSERSGLYVAGNVPGNKDQKLFIAGVHYFK